MKDKNHQIKKYSEMSVGEKSLHLVKNHSKLLVKIFTNKLIKSKLINPIYDLITSFYKNPDAVMNWWWQAMEEEAKEKNAKYDAQTIALWRQHYNQMSPLLNKVDFDYTKIQSIDELNELKNQISNKLIPDLQNRITLAGNIVTQQENAANNKELDIKDKQSKQNSLNAQKPRQRTNDVEDIIDTFCRDNQQNRRFRYKGRLNASAIYNELLEDAKNPEPEYNDNERLSRKIVERVVRKFNSQNK